MSTGYLGISGKVHECREIDILTLHYLKTCPSANIKNRQYGESVEIFIWFDKLSLKFVYSYIIQSNNFSRKESRKVQDKNFWNIISIFIIFVIIIFCTSPAFASEESPVGMDKFKLSIGGFFSTIDSKLKINSKTIGMGTEFDIESDLGFDEDVSLGRIEGYWRFAKKHRLYLGYYGFDRDALHTLEKEIIINDKLFEVGAELYSNWEIDFFYASYGYSFFQGNKWELSGLLGLYYLNTAFTTRGTARIVGDPGGITRERTEKDGLDLPIPLFGLSAEYYITPKWRAIARVSYFTISLGEWSGHIFDTSAYLEYLFHKNFGIGVGYLYFDTDVDRDRDTRNLHLDYQYSGVQVYGIWHF